MGHDKQRLFRFLKSIYFALKILLSFQMALGPSLVSAKEGGSEESSITSSTAPQSAGNGSLIVDEAADLVVHAESLNPEEAQRRLTEMSATQSATETVVTYVAGESNAPDAPDATNATNASNDSLDRAETSLRDSIHRFAKTNFIFRVGQIFRKKIRALAVELKSKGLAESETKSPLWRRAGKVTLVTISASAIYSGMFGAVPALPALMDGGAYKAVFVLSQNLPMITQMFLLGLVVNGFQLVPRIWHGFKESGAKLAANVAEKTSTIIGRSFSREGVADWGRLGAVAVFNGMAGVGVQYIEGHMSLWLSVVYMLAGSWDTVWELALGKQVDAKLLGHRAVEKFTTFRIFVSPFVEPFIWIDTPLRLGAIGLISVAGTLGLAGIFANRKITELAVMAHDRRSRWAGSPKSEVSRAATPRTVTCNGLLTTDSEPSRAVFGLRYADDVQ